MIDFLAEPALKFVDHLVKLLLMIPRHIAFLYYALMALDIEYRLVRCYIRLMES